MERPSRLKSTTSTTTVLTTLGPLIRMGSFCSSISKTCPQSAPRSRLPPFRHQRKLRRWPVPLPLKAPNQPPPAPQPLAARPTRPVHPLWGVEAQFLPQASHLPPRPLRPHHPPRLRPPHRKH